MRQTEVKWDGIRVTTFPIRFLLPSNRNLSIHIGQEARSHPTKHEKEIKTQRRAQIGERPDFLPELYDIHLV